MRASPYSEDGVADRWSAADDTLARGRGDCEDYALAKLAMLRRAGFADRDLYLVLVKDLARRADHAVLVVRSDGKISGARQWHRHRSSIAPRCATIARS